MDQEVVRRIIYKLRHHKTELDNVELKAANHDHPNELWKTFSAFANHSNGGIIICGLDEDAGFKTVEIYDTSKLQEHIISVASQMEPALCPETTVMDFEGKTIVVIEIPAVPLEQRPCYYRPKGLYEGGSYIRISTTNRRMTPYEINICLNNRTQPHFDTEPVLNATTIEDLDTEKIDAYLEYLKRTRPKAHYLKLPRDQQLKQLHIVANKDGELHPSLASLLIFGYSPQLSEPQLVITYLQYYGLTETELAPRGERFLDNRKFEGPISEMIDEAANYIHANTRKASRISGIVREDILEYPDVAIREAIINAVAHRDYSPLAHGSYIQIRLFPNRLEIESPGGLYKVALESLIDDQSTRNPILMRFMEDLNIVENRGSGIDAIFSAVQMANLQPPKFEDEISHFKVTLYNAPLQSNESRILDYTREHGSIRRIECQMLLEIDGRRATHILQKMKDSGQLKQEGTRKGAYYVLP